MTTGTRVLLPISLSIGLSSQPRTQTRFPHKHDPPISNLNEPSCGMSSSIPLTDNGRKRHSLGRSLGALSLVTAGMPVRLTLPA